MLNLKRDFIEYSSYVRKKKFSYSHEKKLLLFGKRLSSSGYFNYETILKNKDELQKDGFYKASRMIILFYKEKHYRNEELHKELDRIKTLIKKPKSQPDIYTPEAQEVVKSLEKLGKINPKLAQFYLGLALSGVRIVELEYSIKSYGLRVINNNDGDNNKGFYKIVVNKSRNTKNSYFIYLPSWYRIPDSVSLEYLRRLLFKHKDIVRPKYLRNFFYSSCVEIGISTAIADFFQGRTAITIGNKHYLQTEHHADREYKRLLEHFERLFLH